MTFEPTTRDLETVATLTHARTPADKIAAALGVSEDAFGAWRARLAFGRAYVPAVVIPSKPVRVVPKSPRIVAEHMFETDKNSEENAY